MQNQARSQTEQYFYDGNEHEANVLMQDESYMQENNQRVDDAGQKSYPDGNPEWTADDSAEAQYYDQMLYGNNQAMNDRTVDGYYNY